MSEFSFHIKYQPEQSRLKALLRPILVIPIAFVLSLLTGYYTPFPDYAAGDGIITSVVRATTANAKNAEMMSNYDNHAVLQPARAIHETVQNSLKDHMIIGIITNPPHEKEEESRKPSHETLRDESVTHRDERSFKTSEYPWLHYSMSHLPLDGVGFSGTITFALVLMLLFRNHYPRWWFKWNQEMTRFFVRVLVYSFVIGDKYPSVSDAQDVQLQLTDPDSKPLNRFMPLVKWILAIPHLLIAKLLAFTLLFVLPVGWFAVIILGRYPMWLFDYVEGVLRYKLRVVSYCFLMLTDEYPPFRFH